MKNSGLSVLILALSIMTASCGGSGSSGGTATPPAAAAPVQGQFVDSPVQGLHYTTTSGLSGFTDANGQYNYRVGDTVTFDIGGRVIGNPLQGAPVVTPLSLFGVANTADTQVTNLAQLLLTLASGAPNANNVIQLPATLPPLPATLNFSAAPATFAASITNAGGPALVPQATAIAHLQANFFTVSVTLAGTGSGSVASTPIGITCGATCSFVFSKTNAITLTPTGSGFAGWSNGTGSAAVCNGIAAGPCTFTPTSDSNVTATFNLPPPSTVTISNAGTGSGTVTCNANGGGFGVCAPQYADGTPLVLHATPNSDSTFTGWTNGTGNATGCPNSPADCSMTVNTATTVTANFVLNAVTQFSVTTSKASGNGGDGTILCSANGEAASACGSYPVNTAISIIPTADNRSDFTSWSNGSGSGLTANCNSAPGACNFTLTANTSITGNFNRPVLTVNVGGTGTVSSNPAGINNCTTINCQAPFDKGTAITLTASGAGFSGWSLAGCPGTGTCLITLNTSTVVAATFGTVSSSPIFKFIGAPSRELLAINPASPATPTPVKVNNQNVTLGNPAVAQGTTLDRSSNGLLILSGTFGGNSTVTNIRHETIVFTSGGKVYKASVLVSDGVPGSLPANEPQQVSSLSGVVSCGLGQSYDVVSPNPAVAVITPGTDNSCNTPDDQVVLMHLNDSTGTAPVTLTAGTVPQDGIYDLNTGNLLQTLLVTSAGNLQWMDNAFTPANIANGAGIGEVTVVAEQPDKVFLATSTNLYIYTPSTHTLNATPVVTADAATGFVNAGPGDSTDLNNIFLVQTDGAVYKVPLTTAPGTHIAAKHFTAPNGTVVYDARLSPNKVIIATGSNPFGGGIGTFSPCYNAVPRSCNDGIIAVDKVTANTSTVIEAADPQKAIFLNQSFGNQVLYTINEALPSTFNGAARIIEDASSARELVGSNGGWAGNTLVTSVSLIDLRSATALATFSHFTALGPPALGTISVISSPTGSATLLGTVTASPAVTNLPGFFFDEAQNTAMIGIAPLQASPTSNQPFFVDAALANSLTPVTTPGAAAPWREISDE